MTPNEAGTYTVKVSLVKGTAEPVWLDWYVKGYSKDALFFFSGMTVLFGYPPYSAKLSITLESAPPPGTYTIVIEGYTEDRKVTHTKEVKLVVKEKEMIPTPVPVPPPGKVFNVKASLSNGKLNKIEADPEFTSILISITTSAADEGELKITLPRSLIDAKIGSEDDQFMVLIDGEEAKYDETDVTSSERTLKIPIPAGAEEIEITGTKVSSGTVTVEEMKDTGKPSKPSVTSEGERKVVGKSGIIFNVRDPLPDAVAGKHYSYSFCDPRPSSELLCGGLMHDPSVTNPVGGVQPYTFQKETLLEVGGDIPFGLMLHPNGVLEGTPIKAEAGKTFKFKVCAIDNTRSFVCKRTSLRVVEGGEAREIGEPPEAQIIPGETYKSLTYRLLYQDKIEIVEHHESYPKGDYIATVTHDASADVVLRRLQDFANLYSDLNLEIPIQATITTKYLGGIGKEFFVTGEVECPPVSWSSTVEGIMRPSIEYHEYSPKLRVSFDVLFPKLEGLLGWGICPQEGNLITSFQGQLSRLGLVDDQEARNNCSNSYILLDFDINGGTKSENCIYDEGYVIETKAEGTLSVSPISAERAVEPIPPTEEEPSPLPTTLTGDVRSWTIKNGKEGTICNPVASPDNPCRELSGPLQEGDIIKTGADNYGKIPLHNGRSTTLLGPNTILKLFKISEDEAIFVFFNLPYRVRAMLDAPQGVKTLFAISGCSYVKPDPGSIETLPDPLKITEFEERCSASPAEFFFLITGTEFTFEQQSDKTTRLTVLEGEVQVWKPADQGVIVTVGTNQQLVLEVDAPLVPSSIDPASIDRWWIEAEAAQPQQITPPSGGGCLIATAAFGSELTPQVQFLRNFRDERILSTAAGSSFMNVFNTWYYSFSPNVADAERENPVLQQIIKYAIYPLLGILTVAEKAYSIFNGETGAVTAGFITSSMIGFVYFWPIGYAIAKVRRRFSSNVLIYPVFVSLVGVIAGILISDPILLMITTSAFVITVVGISAVLSSKLISKIIRK